MTLTVRKIPTRRQTYLLILAWVGPYCICRSSILSFLERRWLWERLKVGGEGDIRGWDGWMASPSQWTWVWVNSRSWWWTGRPGVLQSIGSQWVGHDWATELNWTELNWMFTAPCSSAQGAEHGPCPWARVDVGSGQPMGQQWSLRFSFLGIGNFE